MRKKLQNSAVTATVVSDSVHSPPHAVWTPSSSPCLPIPCRQRLAPCCHSGRHCGPGLPPAPGSWVPCTPNLHLPPLHSFVVLSTHLFMAELGGLRCCVSGNAFISTALVLLVEEITSEAVSFHCPEPVLGTPRQCRARSLYVIHFSCLEAFSGPLITALGTSWTSGGIGDISCLTSVAIRR